MDYPKLLTSQSLILEHHATPLCAPHWASNIQDSVILGSTHRPLRLALYGDILERLFWQKRNARTHSCREIDLGRRF
jgi:hypothetical protein